MGSGRRGRSLAREPPRAPPARLYVRSPPRSSSERAPGARHRPPVADVHDVSPSRASGREFGKFWAIAPLANALVLRLGAWHLRLSIELSVSTGTRPVFRSKRPGAPSWPSPRMRRRGRRRQSSLARRARVRYRFASCLPSMAVAATSVCADRARVATAMTPSSLTPIGAVGRGLLAGAAATGVMTAVQTAYYRAKGMEASTTPGEVARRIIEGVSSVRFPTSRSRVRSISACTDSAGRAGECPTASPPAHVPADRFFGAGLCSAWRCGAPRVPR